MGILMVFYILLGGVMDELAMMLLTLPVIFPIISAMDFGIPQDEVGIWFGILMLTVVGVGLIAPPIGLGVLYRHKHRARCVDCEDISSRIAVCRGRLRSTDSANHISRHYARSRSSVQLASPMR